MTLSYLYKVQICHHCGKEGHIQRVSPSKQQVKPYLATKTTDVRPVEVEVDAYEDILGTLEVGNIRKPSNDIIWVDLDVDGKPLKMELDTCMAVSIISFDLYQQKFNRLTLHNTGPSLKNLQRRKYYASGSAQCACALPNTKRVAGYRRYARQVLRCY